MKNTSLMTFKNTQKGSFILNNWRKNYFIPEFINYSQFTYDNGTFTNNIADTKTYFEAFMHIGENLEIRPDVYRLLISYILINKPQRISAIFEKNLTYRYIRFKHNGSLKDVNLFLDLSYLPDGKYCISINIASCDPTTVGGLVFNDIMIEPVLGDKIIDSYPHNYVSNRYKICTLGKSIFDQEHIYYDMGVNSSDGVYKKYTNFIASPDFAPVKPREKYYSYYEINWYGYDINKNYVMLIGSNTECMIPDQIYYVRFDINKSKVDSTFGKELIIVSREPIKNYYMDPILQNSLLLDSYDNETTVLTYGDIELTIPDNEPAIGITNSIKYALDRSRIRENLILNPNFLINQRGYEVVKVEEVDFPFVDRWETEWYANFKVLSAGGLEIRQGALHQFIGKAENFVGKVYTATVSYNGSRYSYTFPPLNTGHIDLRKTFNDNLSIAMYTYGEDLSLRIFPGPGIINWVKLEEGSEFTGYDNPNKDMEFIKCERYLKKISLATSSLIYLDTNHIAFAVPTVFGMTKKPEYCHYNFLNDDWHICENNIDISGFSLESVTRYHSYLKMHFYKLNHGITLDRLPYIKLIGTVFVEVDRY